MSICSRLPIACCVALICAGIACRKDNASTQAADSDQVVVYCSVDAAFARPLLAAFGRRTGIEVHPVFDTEAGKTTGLVHKLLAERSAPRADVWWSSEIFGTMQLADAGVLAPYRPTTADDVPDEYRSDEDLWTAVGLRGRVVAYDPKRTGTDALPRRWADLADARYRGRIAIADPRFGTTRGHMAVLLDLWGRDALTDFYNRLRANDAHVANGNAHTVRLLVQGVVDLAATDIDDVIVARSRGASIDMCYPDLTAPDGNPTVPGTLWIPASAALVRGARHPDAARRLLDDLVSPEMERRLYESESRNHPVRPALREQLDITVPAEAKIDYADAARRLEASDRLASEVLLR